MTPVFIYFDLDDTLLDHKGAEQAALEDLSEQLTLFNGIDSSQLVETYHRINKKLWEEYGNNMLDRDTLQRLRFENTLKALDLDSTVYAEVGSFYMQRYEEHWRWKEKAKSALQEVSEHFKIGILTNGFKEVQRKKIERFELNKYTDHLVISEEVGYLKPQPEIFEHATALARTKPERILYIGDSFSSDIKGGSSFGWQTAWFTNEQDTEKRKVADFVFSQFDELIEKLNV